jgi:hypothetical protein
MSRTGFTHDRWEAQQRHEASIEKTNQIYQGKLALLQTWENKLEPDHLYIQHLRREVQRARTLLKQKIGLFD